MDATTRFSTRVDDYVKYRPSYPGALFDFLRAEIGVGEGCTVVEAGSGTGIFSELLLKRGAEVYGVEPNDAMREAAERLLASYPLFHSIQGSAEQTGVAAHAADHVVAAQAFHWFDPVKTRAEFARILKPNGWVVLVWNDRKTDSTPFLAAYETLLRERSLDYEQVNHRNITEDRIAEFFAPNAFKSRGFANVQRFDWDGLYGRAMSSSYVPGEGHPKYAAFIEGLRSAFDTHADDGRVAFEYDTRVYYGQLG